MLKIVLGVFAYQWRSQDFVRGVAVSNCTDSLPLSPFPFLSLLSPPSPENQLTKFSAVNVILHRQLAGVSPPATATTATPWLRY